MKSRWFIIVGISFMIFTAAACIKGPAETGMFSAQASASITITEPSQIVSPTRDNTQFSPALTADFSATPSDEIKGAVALVYNGPVAAEGCPEAVAECAKSLGMRVKYFDSPRRLPQMLAGASICIFGGSEDDLSPLLEEFSPEIRESLREWIYAGGRYLGICGGAYIASEGWEEYDGFVDGLNLVPIITEAWIEDPDPYIITVDWNGEAREIYYQYGPAFLTEDEPNIDIFAYYSDGYAAALTATLGSGQIVLCGPHPEADEDWLDDDPEPVDAEKWSATDDLAVILFREAFGE